MTVLTASARAVDRSLRNEIDVNGRHTLTTDEPDSLGGTDTAPAPHELLPAMLASCISTMIALYAQRRDWQLGGVHIDVTYDTETVPRDVKVRVPLRTISPPIRSSGCATSPTPVPSAARSRPDSRSRRSSRSTSLHANPPEDGTPAGTTDRTPRANRSALRRPLVVVCARLRGCRTDPR